MEEIVVSVKRVTDIMAEITAASMEQSSGIEQVNQAVTQMDEATQQNAALVEEAAAAAESLEEQAQSLAEAVARFKVSGTGAGGAVRRSPGKDPSASSPRLPVAKAPKGRKARAAGGTVAEEAWEEF
jgi:methyl-accepting chemotaxis protein